MKQTAMKTKVFSFVASLIFLVACEKSSPTGPIDPVKPISVPNSLFHGTWRNVDPNHQLVYMSFDSLRVRHWEKGNRGYNFHEELSYEFSLDTNRIIWRFFNGTSRTRWWYRFSGDTLKINSDSLYKSSWYSFRRFLWYPGLESWIEPIYWDAAYPFPASTGWVTDFAATDTSWLVLTLGSGSMTLLNVSWDGGVQQMQTFPGIYSMDFDSGYLWLMGYFSLEKRSFPSLSLLSTIDLSSYFPNFGPNDEIRGIAIEDSTLYLTAMVVESNTLVGKFYRFRLDGSFIDVRYSHYDVFDLEFSNSRLWATNWTGYIYELDPESLNAIHSYYLADRATQYSSVGRYHGVTIRNGKLYLADLLPNYLRVFEAKLP